MKIYFSLVQMYEDFAMNEFHQKFLSSVGKFSCKILKKLNFFFGCSKNLAKCSESWWKKWRTEFNNHISFCSFFYNREKICFGSGNILCSICLKYSVCSIVWRCWLLVLYRIKLCKIQIFYWLGGNSYHSEFLNMFCV